MDTVAVLGAGTMGHGIAQVCAMAGLEVRLTDARPEAVDLARRRIRANLDKGVAKGKVGEATRDAAMANLRPARSVQAAAEGVDLVVEAVPEDLILKHRLLTEAEAAAPSSAILASNTSSLSIDAIAEAVDLPARLVGAHFFNPVHLMPLLELVRGTQTADEVVSAMQAFGERIGKEVIVVHDSPGFATSRLGVCLGMEAIRMLEEGVASAEDIDKAMVLGYRHPIGPLRLTDLVGLDVRLAIGRYLADTLGNAAFEPPALLERLVEEGKLGKKTGEGFHRWP